MCVSALPRVILPGAAIEAEPVKADVLQSLSGPRAICEVAVKNAGMMAAGAINSAVGLRRTPQTRYSQRTAKLVLYDRTVIVSGGWMLSGFSTYETPEGAGFFIV